jgi:hypothetical protein
MRVEKTPAFLVVGTSGTLAFAAIVVIEHFLKSNLSPASHEISEYANGRYGGLMAAGFAAWSLSLAASALASLATHRLAASALSGLLLLAATGIATTAIFHTRTSAGMLPPGVAHTTGGELHNLGSELALLSIAAAVVVAMPVVGGLRWQILSGGLILLAVTSSVILLAIGPQVAGIRQRLLVAIACTWQLMLLRCLSRRRR